MELKLKTEEEFYYKLRNKESLNLRNCIINLSDLSITNNANIHIFKSKASFESAIDLLIEETIKLFEKISVSNFSFNKESRYIKKIINLISTLENDIVHFEISFNTYEDKKFPFYKKVEYIKSFNVYMVPNFLYQTRLNKESITVIETHFKG